MTVKKPKKAAPKVKALVKNPPPKMRVRGPGKSKLASLSQHSTGAGGVQYPVRMTRTEADLLNDLENKLKEKYPKANRSRIFRAAIHLCSTDTRSRNLLLDKMREFL
jgi:hypothetical protein